MKKSILILLAIAAIVFIGIAVYYWATPAGQLAHGFPGYEAGSTHKHLKHGFAALILALGCGVIAWFATGKKKAQNVDSSES